MKKNELGIKKNIKSCILKNKTDELMPTRQVE
jgi:hypothetical protein